ncbi:hypothetical protein BDW22DRAFT_1415625 [Trametopsis cervina]|nr:hypothetical protein BDW22DRAFT_1415625 [Trametopsis cervina]
MTTDKSLLIPPLFGDGKGQYRVHIVGNAGSGKSTLGAELAVTLGVPFVNLDRIFWRPGWQQAPVDEFRASVEKILAECDHGWVVDGNYHAKLGDMIKTKSTDIVWLDPPLVLYFPRIFVRTIRRILGLDPQCSPECNETIREAFFSRDSILWWCLTQHVRLRKREQENFRMDGVHVGGRYRRIGGWGSELESWKQSVRDMVAADASATVEQSI